MSRIVWTQDSVAGVPLKRYVGAIEVGNITYDGSNRFWVWATPLQEDAWVYGPTDDAAQKALELWLVAWLGNFRAFSKAPNGLVSSAVTGRRLGRRGKRFIFESDEGLEAADEVLDQFVGVGKVIRLICVARGGRGRHEAVPLPHLLNG